MFPALLALAAVNAAISPAKLFVTTAHGVAITDYPNMARCEAARAFLLIAWRRAQDASSPQGYKIVEYAPLTAICIPG